MNETEQRISELERMLREVSTSESDPKDPRVVFEQHLREEHNRLLLGIRKGQS